MILSNRDVFRPDATSRPVAPSMKSKTNFGWRLRAKFRASSEEKIGLVFVVIFSCGEIAFSLVPLKIVSQLYIRRSTNNKLNFMNNLYEKAMNECMDHPRHQIFEIILDYR